MTGAIETVAGFLPAIAVVLFAIPAYLGVIHQRGFLKGLLTIILLGLFALVSGTLALKTGFPYGNFTYGDILGYKLFGSTPWILVLAYPPILLAAFWMASKFTSTLWRVLLTAVFATMIDVVLDPAMVILEFWSWENAGPFYGVPIINFLGWLLNGLVAGLILHLLWGKERKATVSLALGGIGMLLFWTGASIGTGLWVPAAIGTLVSLSALVIGYEERRHNLLEGYEDETQEETPQDFEDPHVSIVGD